MPRHKWNALLPEVLLALLIAVICGPGVIWRIMQLWGAVA